jgi:hypothetical protein
MVNHDYARTEKLRKVSASLRETADALDREAEELEQPKEVLVAVKLLSNNSDHLTLKDYTYRADQQLVPGTIVVVPSTERWHPATLYGVVQGAAYTNPSRDTWGYEKIERVVA